jgi:hypothetical protein
MMSSVWIATDISMENRFGRDGFLVDVSIFHTKAQSTISIEQPPKFVRFQVH